MARTLFVVSLCATRSHPQRESAAPALPKSSLRRSMRALSRIVAASCFNRVAPGNHGAHLVPDAGDENHKHVNQHKGDERKRRNEVHCSHGLATTENLNQPWKGCVEAR